MNKDFKPKLVRDKIPEIMTLKGQKPVTRIIECKKEMLQCLKDKLLEECDEFICATNDEEAKMEIADILEVIDGICLNRGYDRQEIEKCKTDKKNKRGGFENGVFLLKC